jgi:ribosome-binding protein aMBF1 (putative translation factor)
MCESQRLPEAIQYARELIHPSQQNLSEKLDSLIKTGVEAWEQGGVDDADKILREVEQAAKKLSYL